MPQATLPPQLRGKAIRVETKKLVKALHKVRKKFNVETGKLLRMTTFDLLGRVIKKTPVQFGRARGGWLPYAVAKGMAVSAAGEKAAQGMNEGSFTEKLTGTFKYIDIVNSVPYIIMLEFGTSKQAPEGMVRVSMREITSGLQRALKKLAKKAVKK